MLACFCAKGPSAAAVVMPIVCQGNNIPEKQQQQNAQVQVQPTNINQGGKSSSSAFQPYKRQPDPFSGAPFDEPQTKPRLSTPEAQTPSRLKSQQDRRRSKDKKTCVNAKDR